MAKDKGKDKGKGKGKGAKGEQIVEVVPLEVAAAGAQLGLSLLVALALSWPLLAAAFRGAIPFTTAALRFLLCFVVARIGAAVVWWLYRGYREANERRRAEAEAEAAGERSPFTLRQGDLYTENR